MADELQWLRPSLGEACTQGAQILRWQGPDGRPVLYVSERTRLEPGKPIRGGMPVIFPWFGEDPSGKGKAHGVVRRREWRVEPETDLEQGLLALSLEDCKKTRKEWDAAFALRLRARLGAQLQVEVDVENRGDQPFAFEFSLHAYFAVSDVRQIRIHGLGGAECVDFVDGGRRFLVGEEPITVTGEVERFCHGTTAPWVLEDPAWARRIVIARQGLQSCVLWNPGPEKAAAMSDFGPEEWTRTVCLEPANIRQDQVELAPGGRCRMAVTVHVEPL